MYIQIHSHCKLIVLNLARWLSVPFIQWFQFYAMHDNLYLHLASASIHVMQYQISLCIITTLYSLQIILFCKILYMLLTRIIFFLVISVVCQLFKPGFSKRVLNQGLLLTERLEAFSVIILCYSLVLSCGHEKIVFSKISLDTSFLKKGRCDDFKLFVI